MHFNPLDSQWNLLCVGTATSSLFKFTNTGDAQSPNSETSVETPVNSSSYETSADVSYEQNATEETSPSSSALKPDSAAFEGLCLQIK